MDKINNGGPAFPCKNGHQGMTLRDWFAGQAMQALFTGIAMRDTTWNNTAEAETAYQIADAMIAARDKEAQP